MTEPTKERQNWGNGKIVFELFPPEYLALDAELRTGYHPKLDFIAGYPVDEMDVKLAQIAAYCEVMLDGVYNLTNRIELCDILTKKLLLKREYPQAVTILLPNSVTLEGERDDLAKS